jgi:hypothetical protein
MKWCLHCGEDFSSDGICWPCWGMPKPEPKNPKNPEPKNPKNPEPKEPK